MAISIAKMAIDDLDFAVALTDAENWGFSRPDFERLMSLAPEGCFVARGLLRRVGIVTTIMHGDYGFMGTLVVMKRYRRSGFGEALFARALAFLRDRGTRTIELNGVFPAVSLYRRLGFIDKHLSFRFIRPPAPSTARSGQLLTVTTDEIVRFDREHLPIDRSAILTRLGDDYRDSLFALGDDRLSAYAFAKSRPSGSVTIGPLVARSSDAAVALLRTIVSRYHDRTLLIVVPDMKAQFLQALLDEGFLYQSPWLRMYSGERLELDGYVYGIIAPNK